MPGKHLKLLGNEAVSAKLLCLGSRSSWEVGGSGKA